MQTSLAPVLIRFDVVSSHWLPIWRIALVTSMELPQEDLAYPVQVAIYTLAAGSDVLGGVYIASFLLNFLQEACLESA